MDDKLSILQHLYGEDEPAGLTAVIERDDALRREYQALRETKFYLEHRPAKRPDAQVLDTVFAAAERASLDSGERRDRPAQPHRARNRLRVAGAVSSVCAVLVLAVVGFGYFQHPAPPAEPSTSRVDVAAKMTPAPQVASTPAKVPDVLAPEQDREVAEIAARSAPVEQVSAPETPHVRTRRPTPVSLQWDESAEMRQLHRRVGFIEARTTKAWNTTDLPGAGASGTSGFERVDWDY